MVPDLIGDLRRQIEDLERTVADLTRQNEQLREAVAALLSPDKVSADFTGRAPRWSFDR
jgi:cell division protein FtsL